MYLHQYAVSLGTKLQMSLDCTSLSYFFFSLLPKLFFFFFFMKQNMQESFWSPKWHIKGGTEGKWYYMLICESLPEPRLKSGRRGAHFYSWMCINQKPKTCHCVISEAKLHQHSYISTCSKCRAPAGPSPGGSVTKSSCRNTRSKGRFIDTT